MLTSYNRLYDQLVQQENVCIHDAAGCTTGCIEYTDIFLVVQPAVQPVVQQVASCIRGLMGTCQLCRSWSAVVHIRRVLTWQSIDLHPTGRDLAQTMYNKEGCTVLNNVHSDSPCHAGRAQENKPVSVD